MGGTVGSSGWKNNISPREPVTPALAHQLRGKREGWRFKFLQPPSSQLSFLSVASVLYVWEASVVLSSNNRKSIRFPTVAILVSAT
jgi:hypothetical protein